MSLQPGVVFKRTDKYTDINGHFPLPHANEGLPRGRGSSS